MIGAAHNQVEGSKDPTAHAEMLAITQAAAKLGDWRLEGATVYVTKEPCPMCSGAMVMARVKRVCFAVPDPKMGCLGGAANLNDLPRSNHHFEVTAGGVLEDRVPRAPPGVLPAEEVGTGRAGRRATIGHSRTRA